MYLVTDCFKNDGLAMLEENEETKKNVQITQAELQTQFQEITWFIWCASQNNKMAHLVQLQY